MRKLIIIVLILVSASTFSQNTQEKTHKPLPLELGININKFNSNDNGIENRMGFGLSVKRIWMSDRRINILSGLVFNQIHYFEETVMISHFSHYRNMDFRLYSFTIPLLVRANFGNTYKLFIETGPSLDLIPYLHGKGTIAYYPPTGTYSETNYSGGFDTQLLNFSINTSVGIKFPVKKNRLFIGSTYHLFIFHNSISDIKFRNALIALNFGMYLN